MSLSALIEGKTRRTDVLPVRVGDTSAAAAAVATHRAALEAHQSKARFRQENGAEPSSTDAEQEERLRAALAAALQRQAATIVLVPVQALEPDVWDQLLDTLEEDETGELDLTDVRATLLAASCVDDDPNLRDAQWWATQLARPEWSKGELLAVNNLLLSLNLNVPDGRAGKG